MEEKGGGARVFSHIEYMNGERMAIEPWTYNECLTVLLRIFPYSSL